MDVEQEIHRRIVEQGRITFAEFMDLALFWPDGGYYSRPDNIGSQGDFYTSPGAHPAFGALLCLQVYQMWRIMGSPSNFYLVEMGAGSGLLCHDLLSYSAHFPGGFRDSLQYLCLDRSPSQGAEALLPVGTKGIVERLATRNVPLRRVKGCFLSNELVDSMPVHRVAVQDGALKEVYLALEDGHLAEVLDSPSTPALEERLDALDLSLPEGFSAEINLSLRPWLEEVSSALEQGFLLTIDYGHPAPELYSASRRRGTLTCFYRHTQTDSPYMRIGRQDITAQVDFTSLIDVGRRLGLETQGLTTQGEFLQNLGIGHFISRLPSAGLSQRQVMANRMGMLDIIRPGGIGDFKVLVQGKRVDSPHIWGLGSTTGEVGKPTEELDAMLRELPIPLLTPHHVPLLEGRYPHLAPEWAPGWEDLLTLTPPAQLP